MRYLPAVLCFGLVVLLVALACSGKESAEEKAELIRLVDKLLRQSGEEITVDQALDEAAEEAGIDFRTIDRILVFGDIDSEGYFGVFIEGTFDQSDLRSAIEAEEGPLNKEEYKGQEIYTSIAGEVSITFLESGETLIGSPGPVRDVIDVMEGDADALAGSLMESFEDFGDPLIKLSLEVTEDIFSAEDFETGDVDIPGLSFDIFTEIQSMGVALDEKGDTITVEVSLDYPDRESAKQAVETFDAFITIIETFSGEAELTELLERLDISSAGSTATIRYSATLDELEESIERLADFSGEFLLEDIFGGAGLQDFFGEGIIIPPLPAPGP